MPPRKRARTDQPVRRDFVYIPSPIPAGPVGWRPWVELLGSPQLVAAPLVNQSEAAWRRQVRRRGAELCYSPMLLAEKLVTDPAYRSAVLDAGASWDRPLVVQLAGSTAEAVRAAALMVYGMGVCDAVDINLGCPQQIARNGCYGAFMADDEAAAAVRAVSSAMPCTVKIRRSSHPASTIQRVRRLASAGACAVVLHGRTVEQRPRDSPDWDHVREVSLHPDVAVPVIGNGGLIEPADVWRLLDTCKCAAVMSGIGLLRDPGFYQRAVCEKVGASAAASVPDRVCLAAEYLDSDCAAHPPSHPSIPRKHVFWMCGDELERQLDLYDKLFRAKSGADVRAVVAEVQHRLATGHTVEVHSRPGGRERRRGKDGRLAAPPIGGLGMCVEG